MAPPTAADPPPTKTTSSPPTTPTKPSLTPDDKRLISFRIAHTPEPTSPTRSPPRSPGRKSPKSASPKNKKQSSKLKADAAPFPVVEVRAPPLPPVTALSQVLAFDVRGGDDDDKPRRARRSSSGASSSSASTQSAAAGEGAPAVPPSSDLPLRPLKENVDADEGSKDRVAALERALAEAQAANETLARELRAARDDARDARRDADRWRAEAAACSEKAAHHAASEAEATAGLEREAEMAWREAETWVEHEEALELREEFLQSRATDESEHRSAATPSAGASPRSCFSGASWSAGRGAAMKPSHFLPPSPKRDAAADADDDDEGDAWAVALHRSATARPSPSRTLHEKLSSPHRKPPSPAETRKRAEERQVAAMRNRGRLRCEQSARLREAAAHARGVRVAKELAVAAREAESARRHDRAEARHAAHLESVRKKAVRESNKVDEISFINEMGLLDMQFDLKRRLNEMEARIDEARARRARLLAGVSSKQQAREKDKEDKLASVGGVRAFRFSARLVRGLRRRARRRAASIRSRRGVSSGPEGGRRLAREQRIEAARLRARRRSPRTSRAKKKHLAGSWEKTPRYT